MVNKTDIFKEKAKIIHNNKYDYSKSEYKTSEEKVCIICPIHGEFWQTPHGHLRGQGCPNCGIERRKNNTQEFIEKAKEIHGDKYDYSKTKYTDSFNYVIVNCSKHGDFKIIANAHTCKKQGCPMCSKEQGTEKKCLGKETFINNAIKIHGDKYDYSKVIYKNNYTKVIITCPIHGDFEQVPHSHLRGGGCPFCKESHLEREIKLFLESKNIEFTRYFKSPILKWQTLDFYLPKYNVGIECQGQQHIRGKWFRGRQDSHDNNIIEKDIAKYHKCEDNGIRLLYYTNRNKYVETMVNEKKFKGIYTENNTFCNKEKLLEKIKEG